MADEAMSDGEIRRSFDRVERALKDGDDRHAALAARMVPVDLWKSEHRTLESRLQEHRDGTREALERVERTAQERRAALAQEIAAVRTLVEREVEDLREEIKALRAERAKRSEITWQKITGLIAALAGAALVIVTLFSHGGGH